jgi:predicted nucleic acid-binding Zn ribbon protein
MQHIGSALEKVIQSQGLEEGLSQQKAIDVWGEVVGLSVSKNTEAVSAENGLLIIKTINSTWRLELQLQKGNIIKKINKRLEKKTIKDIRFL